MRFVLYNLDYPLGRAGFHLPDYIKQSKSIIALNKRMDGVAYKDHLSIFRFIAVHRGHRRDHLETYTKTLFGRWVQFYKELYRDVIEDTATFQGLPIDEIAHFEKCFEANVNIFQLRDDGVVLNVYKSMCRYKDTMHLNIFQHHLSYITNLPAYTQRYECGTCDRHFKDMRNIKKHQKMCTGQTKYVFRGGFYSNPKTAFDKLEEQGIIVSETNMVFKWFIVFDFEPMFSPRPWIEFRKITWKHKHVPISFSCSNFEGFTATHAIVDPDVERLVGKMVGYMTIICDKTYELVTEMFDDAFQQPEKNIQNPMRALNEDEDEYKLDAFLDDEDY